MKITFFKSESHFHPRISYCRENIGFVKISFDPLLKRIIRGLIAIPFLVFMCYFYIKLFKDHIVKNHLIYMAIIVCYLPLHELCHAVFCWLSKRKVERINFFPYYKRFFSHPFAYVKPSFGVWSKKQAILFFAFPLLLLSVTPALLAMFIPSLRIWLLFASWYNISLSNFDIVDILCLLRLPRNSLYFGDFVATVKDIEKPSTIHRLSVTPKLDTIHHSCFEYFNGKLTEKEQVYETNATEKLKQEFIKQFNLK